MHTSKHTMGRDRKRAHVVIPEDLLREVDDLVGARGRSRFFVEAAQEKLARMRLRTAAHALVGSLRDLGTPGWETPESSPAWVRELRSESDEKALSSSGE